MVIDMHAHWVPPVITAALRARRSAPMIARRPNGEEYLDNGGPIPLWLPEGFDDDVETRLAKMDQGGVGHGLLSLATQYRIEWLPTDQALPLCRAFNDAVSQACESHPDRFSGLAVLPALDANSALAEFERSMSLPGIVGALLIGDAFLTVKRAERYQDILAAANDRNAILFVHYGQLPDDQEAPQVDTSDSAFVRIVTLDFQARLSSNMVTFCLTDLLKDYPNVTVMSHNLGGNIAFEIERMDHRALIDQGPDAPLPSKRFRDANILVDCNSLGARAIELATAVFGADKVVFGTDGSMFGAQWSLDAIRDARISDHEKQAILELNAAAALARARAGAHHAARHVMARTPSQ